MGRTTMDQERQELIKERYELAYERICELKQGTDCREEYKDYFETRAGWILLVCAHYDAAASGALREKSLPELEAMNRALYEEILPDQYEKSYASPVYCGHLFGTEQGQLLAALAAELRAMIPYAYEGKQEELLIRMELLLQIYQIYAGAYAEDVPVPLGEVRDAIYWYVSDYYETQMADRIAQQVDPDHGMLVRLLDEADGSDLRYLYYYGEYVGPNQIGMAQHMNRLSDEVIATMADTYTEGFRIGFEVTGRDLSIKSSVNMRYFAGMERMMQKAADNFRGLGLSPVIYRATSNLFYGRPLSPIGVFFDSPNRQYDYDHREDMSLILDGRLVQRRLECLKAGYEAVKEKARKLAGPAVVEVFGETIFDPVTGHGEPTYTEKQQKLTVEYASKAGQITNEYIPGEERSFTIIAFPVPEIGDAFGDIFDETVRINTLDYMKYRNMQQKIIDVLDLGEKVIIRGQGVNHTHLEISLHTLDKPEEQTNFENCVADVNIPVGEVFTSPLLKGTSGVLHVSRVFLNGLEYRDLEIRVEDGMITDYSCKNYEEEEKNRKLIRDNILYHRETLPMGEFAIGTNTTAYVMGRKYGIEAKLPILIAEKTGPHFAFGDTCYSHSEDVKVYNPDGKEIIARDNECSLLRTQDPSKAYFNCHTDITIPYDELGEISVLTSEGSMMTILENGRFTVPGCEELNVPLDQAAE